MEKFITMIQTEKFDYTKWRENLFIGLSGEEINKQAMEYKRKKIISDIQVYVPYFGSKKISAYTIGIVRQTL